MNRRTTTRVPGQANGSITPRGLIKTGRNRRWRCLAANGSFRWILALIGTLIFTAPGNSNAEVTSLFLNSQAGDSIGRGQALFFTPADGTFAGTYSSIDSNAATLSFVSSAGFSGHWFYMTFDAPLGEVLQVGTYTGTTRFNGMNQPGLDVFGEGHACNSSTGQFEVKQITFGDNAQVLSFWATFEQHCEGATPALFGEIRYNADVPVVVSAPVLVTGTEGSSVAVSVSAADAQGRHVTLSVSNLPPGATFVDHGDNTALLSWLTPQAGTFQVLFHGDNGASASGDATSRIVINLANDEITNAVRISSLPYTNLLADIAPATRSNYDPYCPGNVAKTVWYSFTPATNTHIEARLTDASFQSVIGAYYGTVPNLFGVQCAYSSGQTDPFISFDAVGGRTYYFLVAGYDQSASGPVKLWVAQRLPPPNDDMSKATTITSFPFRDQLNTSLATRSADDPGSCSLGANVWYQLAPAEDLFVHCETCMSDYSTAIGIFEISPGGLYVQCAGNSACGFTAFAGRTYFIMVGNPTGGGTGGHLDVSFEAHPKLKIGLIVNDAGCVDNKTGIAIIHGYVTNSAPVTVCVQGNLTQQIGRPKIKAGDFPSGASCLVLPFSGVAPFSVRVPAPRGSLGADHMLVTATAGAQLDEDFAVAEVSTIVHLNCSKSNFSAQTAITTDKPTPAPDDR